jgi:cyclopropane fatty-acyl-phospholipid synthase-like methyltransferase
MSNEKNKITWADFWDKRGFSIVKKDSILQYLINLNGFDKSPNALTSEKFNELAEFTIKQISIEDNSRILEIGCGSGAFIKAINNVSNCKTFGIEPSKSLIKIAREYLPNTLLWNMEAKGISSIPEKFDLIIMHSIIQYFPNLEYLQCVIKDSKKLLNKGGKLICFDIPDHSRKAEYAKDKLIMEIQNSNIDQLSEHLFVEKIFFVNLLKSENYHEIQFFDYPITDYHNRNFRFNISAVRQ